jgi:hypothetical protein
MKYNQNKITKENLYDLYHNKRMSTRKIGKIFNCSHTNILCWLHKYNIKIRKNVELGEKHYNWKGGVRKQNHGYILQYAPDHPRSNDRMKVVLQHILVMEKHIGRYLKDGEIVHHINGNKSDNRIENLKIMFDRDHKSYHAQLNKDKYKKLGKEQVKHRQRDIKGRFI